MFVKDTLPMFKMSYLHFACMFVKVISVGHPNHGISPLTVQKNGEKNATDS